MRILGLSAFHRDAAAALVVDGEVVAAAQEERFTRLTLDAAFPKRATRWCLAASRIRAAELDRVVFYEKPLAKFERVLARSLAHFPRSARSFSRSAFLWLGERLWVRNRIAHDLELPPERVLFVEQARAQLANAFYTSPFTEAALLLLDDVCEWTTAAFGHGRGTEVELLLELRHPHSLGFFASALTQFLGFAPGEEEHKLEALAALGDPTFAAELERCFRLDGPFFELDQALFRFEDGAERLFGSELEQRLGPARRSGDPLRSGAPDARDADLAASVEHVLEERALALARELHRRVPCAKLCLAGLLASNRRLCARLLADGPFQALHVPSAPGKAGGALGAALFAHHALDPGAPRRAAAACALGESIDGPGEPGAEELGSAERARDEITARLLRGELVGWARGALEFASRSLGNRVVLALPREGGARQRLLSALRQVEDFLPCRIALPSAQAHEFFVLAAGSETLLRQGHVLAPARASLRARAPCAVLADGTAWPQLVDEHADPELHGLLMRLEAQGQAPLVLVTDLALRGSPLVHSESEAVEAFARSGLDALIVSTRLYV